MSPRHIHVHIHVRVRVYPIRAFSTQDASSDSTISASTHPVPLQRPTSPFGHGHNPPGPNTIPSETVLIKPPPSSSKHLCSRQVQSPLGAAGRPRRPSSPVGPAPARLQCINSDNGFPRICTGEPVPTSAHMCSSFSSQSVCGPKSPGQRTPAGAVPEPHHGPRGKCFETERDVGAGWLTPPFPFSASTSITCVPPFGMFRFDLLSSTTGTQTSGQTGAFCPPNAQQPSLSHGRH